MLINPVHNYAKTLFKARVAELDKARSSQVESLKGVEMASRLDRLCEIHEEMMDDVAESKVTSVEQAYAEGKRPITGEVVENAMEELRNHTEAIASAIPNSIDSEVALYGTRTGANIEGLTAQAAEIRRKLRRRAAQVEQRADIGLTRLMQRDALPRTSEPGQATSTDQRIQATTSRSVFIGHGRSLLWRELKDFLEDRLHLQVEEFNREPVAGRSTVARLEEMLSAVSFAFIVMTAEDEDKSGELHPRPNVIHEAGLFQGRLGFQRAIILLEQSCAEFSNIHGLNQIRFPKGSISACFEEIRRVLEREGLLGIGVTDAPSPVEFLPPHSRSITKANPPASTGPAVGVKPVKNEIAKGFLPVTQEALTVRLDSGYDQGFIIIVESHADQSFEILGSAAECNGSPLGRINRPPADQTWTVEARGRLSIRWSDDIHPVRALLDVMGQYQGSFADFVDFAFHCLVAGEHKTFRKKIKVQVDALNRSLTQWA